MPKSDIYLSTLWPPLRGRPQPHSSTFDILEAAGLVRRGPVLGTHVWLPLGLRVREQIAAVCRRSFEDRGFSSVNFPALQSAKLWKSSGRWDVYTSDRSLFTVNGTEDGALCLAPTSEEMAVETVKADLSSYRDLPARLFLCTSKYRNELSPRGGLMRANEFEMADAYTFDTEPRTMQYSVELLNEACAAALSSIGLKGAAIVDADGGSISSGPSSEHVILGAFGQSNILGCAHCGTRGAAEVISALPQPLYYDDDGLRVVKVMVFVTKNTGRLVSVLLPLDLDVSLRKVASIVGEQLRLADPQTIVTTFDAVPGQLNPWSVVDRADVVVCDNIASQWDDFAIAESDLVVGGMRWSGCDGRRALNILSADVHCAASEMICSACREGSLKGLDAVELAHVFELGTEYSQKMGLMYIGKDGSPAYPYMACSGIGVTRAVQTLAERGRDSRGLRWPWGIGPADVHIVALRHDNDSVRAKVRDLVGSLPAHCRTLVDDRLIEAGEKFSTANMLGVPFQLIVSPKQSGDEVEIINRWTRRTEVLTRAGAIEYLSSQSRLNTLSI